MTPDTLSTRSARPLPVTLSTPGSVWSTWRARLRTLVKVVIINAVILLAMLIPVELVFGTWIRPMGFTDLKRFSIPIKTVFEFDASTLYTGGPRNPILYSRDEWGFRGTYKHVREVDVLTIGGSTTDQRYLDDLATWQAVAERELRQKGRPLVIANAGVDGQSTVGHDFNFRYWFPLMPELRPRIMLFYLGVNDVIRHEERVDSDARVDARSWQTKSALYLLRRTIRENLRARRARVWHERVPRLSPEDFTEQGLLSPEQRAEVSSNVTKIFLSNVEGLRRHTVAAGAAPIFVTQTAYGWSGGGNTPRGVKETVRIYGYTVNYSDVAFLHQHMNRGLVDYCAQNRVTCFDMANDVTFEADDYYDYVHNTPQGAEKVGRYVAEKLATLDLASLGR